MQPQTPALKDAAYRSLRSGDIKAAIPLLERVVALDSADITSWLSLAAARRQSGDAEGAIEAADQVLKLEPRNFMALLGKGAVLEQLGKRLEAANTYGAALTQAPPDSALDPATLGAVQHARQINATYVNELNSFIRAEVRDEASHCSRSEAQRLDAFIDMTLRRRPRYQQQPSDFFYPGLPNIEFYERDEFPWLEAFEAQTQAILAEAEAVLGGADGFVPYVIYNDTLPLDQWRELNNNLRWSAFHFSFYGKPYEENQRRCPNTMAALKNVPQPQIPNRCPASLFSVLKPRTRIPPHTGVANIRLVVHLPLIVPERCGFRVGNETREWRVGEGWVFDDTIEHEAWNDSDQVRTIFICDVWNPRLSEAERRAITSVMIAMDAFGASSAQWGV